MERFILWTEIMAMIRLSAKQFAELVTLLRKSFNLILYFNSLEYPTLNTSHHPFIYIKNSRSQDE